MTVDTRLAQDLREIVRLTDHLTEQAEHDARRGDIANSDAMVMLGPAAHLSAWEARLIGSVLGRTAPGFGEDDYDSDPAPPLLVLATWEDVVRDERDEPTALRATVERAADYLRSRIDWMTGFDEDGRPNFLPLDELTQDVRRCRSRLEAVLRDGVRDELGVPCMYDGKRLRRTIDDRGKRSDWTCRSCGRTWTELEYAQRVTAANEAAKQEVIEGETWCAEDYAARDTGRSVKTIRTWVDRGYVRTACIVAGRRTRFVCLDDVRVQHRVAKTRRTRAA